MLQLPASAGALSGGTPLPVIENTIKVQPALAVGPRHVRPRLRKSNPPHQRGNAGGSSSSTTLAKAAGGFPLGLASVHSKSYSATDTCEASMSLPAVVGAAPDSTGTAKESTQSFWPSSVPSPLRKSAMLSRTMPQLSRARAMDWHKDQVIVGLQSLRGPSMSTAERLMSAAVGQPLLSINVTKPVNLAQPTSQPWQQAPSETSRQESATSRRRAPSEVSEVSATASSDEDNGNQGFRDTGQLWRKYLSAKSMSAPQLERQPLWNRIGDAADEKQIAGRLRELEDMDDWQRHRGFLQRHIRELPDSGMKRRLVGDPRFHNMPAINDIHRVNQEDIQRHRDRVRKIQDVMGECSKSRHQLMRMQKQLNPPTEVPSLPFSLGPSPAFEEMGWEQGALSNGNQFR